MKAKQWTEANLTQALVRGFFKSAVLAVPCCGWYGHEADLLVVTKDLRLIDVEMKISRADLKADVKKDKWWYRRAWARSRPMEPLKRDWPPRVWKHYYLMPRAIWTPELLEGLPETSGVLLAHGSRSIECYRRAMPSREAERLGSHEVIDIARLAGLRLWDALERIDRLQPSKEPPVCESPSTLTRTTF
ncbi:MmcB family DNA repair protein [Edwardsiella phage vB_EpM_ZHS]|nr:MmcB family DNA repair protein [Edwardsiella phage vB_EpM_ZHS]